MPRLLAAGALVCGAAAVAAGGVAGATLDPDRERELAQAQFQVYLLIHTDFRPSNVTCTTPAGVGATGDLVCFAMVNDRETISAVATPAGDGTFSFLAVDKAGGPPAARPTTSTSTSTSTSTTTTSTTTGTTTGEPGEPGALDAAVDAFMYGFEDDAAILETTIADWSEHDVTVLEMQWQPEVATLYIEIDPDDADVTAAELAWIVTDSIAGGWEADSPTRADGVTLQPRVEVWIDGTMFGTPFEVMAQVADYEITEPQWLEIVTGVAPAAGAAGTASALRAPGGAVAAGLHTGTRHA